MNETGTERKAIEMGELTLRKSSFVDWIGHSFGHHVHSVTNFYVRQRTGNYFYEM